MQALYNTRNRSERIRFARKKRSEGYTVTRKCHGTKTYSANGKKKDAIEEVQILYSEK